MAGTSQRIGWWIGGALALTLALPSAAPAASTKPTVSTGAAADVTPQSATLLGRVTPNGAQTTYRFQYGTTTLYSAATAPVVLAGGAAAVNVSAQLAGLAPNTTYHYRLVARNRNGTVEGVDRTFRTRRMPLGLTLAAAPSPVPFGRPAVLAGALTGTGSAGRPIVLQANPFPYTAGFQPTANVQLTDAEGRFAFPLLAVGMNTQYRVAMPDRPEIQSPIVSLGVAVRVSTHTSATRVRSGRAVRFFGTVRPARPGAQFAIQRRRGSRWVTVAGGIARGARGGVSRFAKRVRIRRGGSYRVFVAVADGMLVSAAGRTVRIRRAR